ncbi:MAG TPA: hypothetical protein DIW77_15225 [Chromatiaceae bacterium]|nr:MAG: hypothetical protein N838_11805 [Thiohalocapsa sp. PB-PSB1]HCS91346.1 hypothetical protein [Chromatiaceae bacterium]
MDVHILHGPWRRRSQQRVSQQLGLPALPHHNRDLISMPTKTPVVLACLLLGSSATQAQNAYTPQPGSEERKAILNAARPTVAADLSYRGKLRFLVKSLLVSGDWALLVAEPQTPSGTILHKNCLGADDTTMVLLKRSKVTWNVERGGTTCDTDVFWLEWPSEAGAPAAIFRFNEKSGAD